MDITPGSVVRLKSGGPRMTVVELDGSDVLCQWFDEKKKACNGRFALVAVELPPKPALGMVVV